MFLLIKDDTDKLMHFIKQFVNNNSEFAFIFYKEDGVLFGTGKINNLITLISPLI